MDGGRHPECFGIEREFISPLNINRLLRKCRVPYDVDIISIDVNGQDFWIWMACDFQLSLYIIELNLNFERPENQLLSHSIGSRRASLGDNLTTR
jgi:hypothetical protein